MPNMNEHFSTINWAVAAKAPVADFDWGIVLIHELNKNIKSIETS